MDKFCPNDKEPLAFAIRYLSHVCPKCWAIWPQLEPEGEVLETDRHWYTNPAIK